MRSQLCSLSRKLYVAIIATLFLLNSTSYANTSESTYNHIFQVATIGSLTKGVYDGDFHYGDLFEKGNLGLGTFETLDGEMVAVDGIYYQIDAKGKLRKVGKDEIVPFAEVVNFKARKKWQISGIKDYKALMSTLKFDNNNLPHAIRIDGDFSSLKLRSLRKQTKPYPSLAEAAKNQAVFNLKNVKGTIVGFWFPAYWAGIAVPGYHLHFVSENRDIGGHVLGLAIDNAMISTAPAHNFSVHLPNTDSFAQANLDPQALHEEMKAAEGGME